MSLHNHYRRSTAVSARGSHNVVRMSCTLRVYHFSRHESDAEGNTRTISANKFGRRPTCEIQPRTSSMTREKSTADPAQTTLATAFTLKDHATPRCSRNGEKHAATGLGCHQDLTPDQSLQKFTSFFMMASESVSVPVLACSWSWAACSCSSRLCSSFSRIAFVARTSNRSLRRSISCACKTQRTRDIEQLLPPSNVQTPTSCVFQGGSSPLVCGKYFKPVTNTFGCPGVGGALEIQ